jgi:hypothetical protein
MAIPSGQFTEIPRPQPSRGRLDVVTPVAREVVMLTTDASHVQLQRSRHETRPIGAHPPLSRRLRAHPRAAESPGKNQKSVRRADGLLAHRPSPADRPFPAHVRCGLELGVTARSLLASCATTAHHLEAPCQKQIPPPRPRSTRSALPHARTAPRRASAPVPPGPAIVKDYVKSAKHRWAEACYIPDTRDEARAVEVIRAFLDEQGGDLNGGVVHLPAVPSRGHGPTHGHADHRRTQGLRLARPPAGHRGR